MTDLLNTKMQLLHCVLEIMKKTVLIKFMSLDILYNVCNITCIYIYKFTHDYIQSSLLNHMETGSIPKYLYVYKS